MSSAAEDILCEPHVDRELSDDDNGPGATSRPQSHGGQNKDPCWALVQCIPIKSPDNTIKAPNPAPTEHSQVLSSKSKDLNVFIYHFSIFSKKIYDKCNVQWNIT